MNKQKGFTIIELIVVIAIIAVLAAIILVNVTIYNVKSKDTAAMGDLATLTTAGAKYYEANGNYNNFFLFDLGNPDAPGTNKDVYNIATALIKLGYDVGSTGNDDDLSGSCDNTDNCNGATIATKWCVSIRLKQYSPKQYYCVDSSGTKKQGPGELCDNTAAGVCP